MRSVSEAYILMKSGKSYKIDGFLYKKQAQCSRLLKKINALPFNSKRRNRLLKRLFFDIGINNVIKEGFVCNYGFNISIGSNCYINYGLTVLDSFEVQIGNNVFIAPNVIISPVTHPINAFERRSLQGGKIVIEDDVWICANAVILPGVTIHKGAVVGAGAVVKKDVPANCVVCGMPAEIIKHIDN